VIQSIGGRADVVDRFNGKTDSTGGVYALIAGPSNTAANSWSPGWKASEASYERTQTNGAAPMGTAHPEHLFLELRQHLAWSVMVFAAWPLTA
jgi:hypothetical protein